MKHTRIGDNRNFFYSILNQAVVSQSNNRIVSGRESAHVAANMQNFQIGLGTHRGFYLRCISFKFSHRNEQFGHNKKL